VAAPRETLLDEPKAVDKERSARARSLFMRSSDMCLNSVAPSKSSKRCHLLRSGPQRLRRAETLSYPGTKPQSEAGLGL
jgi:hypothetical protein